MSAECKMKHTMTVLQELREFLRVTDNPRERKNRQKLLRNLRVSYLLAITLVQILI